MIIHADCVEAMQAMEPDSVDAVIADPPYGIGFMGKEWDGAGDGRSWATMGGPSGSDNTKHTERGGAMHAGKYDLSVTANRRFQDWCQLWATEALRVLKPGGHLLAFGGTRTSHRLACAVEDAGFEIRDSLIWIYGSGFPKSLDVSKAIDRNDGHEREITREATEELRPGEAISFDQRASTSRERRDMPKSLQAAAWQGWGTALKPSHEPIVVARKPLIGTVAQNCLEHGTGALNIDGCRIEGVKRTPNFVTPEKETFEPTSYGMRGHTEVDTTQGRWPPNLTLSHLPECKQTGTRKVKGSAPASGPTLHSTESVAHHDYNGERGEVPSYQDESVPVFTCAEGCPVAELDRQSGECPVSGSAKNGTSSDATPNSIFGGPRSQGQLHNDTGGASRFMYVAKASRSERSAGLPLGESSNHPTVKPIALMRWLVRLVTPPGGRVLDPFTGSGSTGVAAVLEGFDFVGIEREAEYVALAEARVAFWAQFPGADVDKVLLSDAKAREIEASGQLGLL